MSFYLSPAYRKHFPNISLYEKHKLELKIYAKSPSQKTSPLNGRISQLNQRPQQLSSYLH